jgi:hypothetical protein
MFSSLFIRTTYDQQDSSFWQSIWRASGAPITDFGQFHQESSSADAAAKLAEILNYFQPQEEFALSYRAPDLIVIIGAAHFLKSIEQTDDPASRPLAVSLVLDEIIAQGRLRIAPTAEGLAPLLGRTRIILLGDDPDDGLDVHVSRVTVERLSQKEQTALLALSAFRWGFNHAMASLVLNDPTLPILRDYKHTWGIMRDFLLALCEKGVLRYGQGWYHLPFSLRDQLQQKLSDIEKATYHMAAGTALAPYTMNDTAPSLAFDRAFLPENLYEAFFHFDRAGWLANNEGLQGKIAGDAALGRKLRLLRFAAFPTWSTIGSLTNCRSHQGYQDGYILGKAMLERSESSHPSQFLPVLQNGVLLHNYEKNRPSIQMILDEELAGSNSLFEKALKACDAPEFQSKRNLNRLMILSVYATYLFRKGSEYTELVEPVNREMMQLIDAGTKARSVRGEWFERMGDTNRNHSEATRIYRQGVQWVPEWHQLWVKALGAASLLGEDVSWATAAIEEYTTNRASKLRESGYPLSPGHPAPSMPCREGLSTLPGHG